MTSSVIAAPGYRLRPAVVATMVTLTFFIGVGAGIALSRVAASSTTHPVTIGALGAADDMSAAAYGATHLAVVLVVPAGADMSAAAYAAMHDAAIGAAAPDGVDMSSAAYGATHPTGTDMGSAAYDAMHQR